MASLGSYIRSAARATFSAYRRIPIRWRLAGGSAALTLVILAGFAAIVGHFTDGAVTNNFHNLVGSSLDQLRDKVKGPRDQLFCEDNPAVSSFASADAAQVRVIADSGQVLCTQYLGQSTANMQRQLPALVPNPGHPLFVEDGYEMAERFITWSPHGAGYLLYGRPLESLDHTLAEVRAFLLLGVLGGTVLALLAGLATAQRAIRPIVGLTDAAREIERTRDPSLHIPRIEADDEVAELARTLEGMLGALDAARAETEAALARQREFVADASHELRTPLTSVLANLELLADDLDGEPAESAKAALRSTRRMRRLVGDLLLLARADAERHQPHRPVDLGAILTDAAAELGQLADDHDLSIAPGRAEIEGRPDDLHRLVLNLMENALRHTPPGTTVRARSGVRDGIAELIVEDEGPGIPPHLRERVFDRFVRGGGDAGDGARGTGLGLAIVRAVAQAHGARVTLGSLEDGCGTQFVIRFPQRRAGQEGSSPPGELPAQTSTTTGSTIGRRRNRS